MLAQAIQYGAKDFIVKPFQEERLIAALEKVLS
jgi:FixJ family two-component response regulator